MYFYPHRLYNKFLRFNANMRGKASTPLNEFESKQEQLG